jgi:hypothetical protein
MSATSVFRSLAATLPTLLPARAGVVDVPGDALGGKPESLARDNRGVIMVVGVMFTFLWIGLAWAIFGIGNAIAYRENLQNAADAAAFAGAVYDARGMNMLASINIVMAVVLAVLIVAHIIQAIALIAFGADCWSCIPDLFCGYGWASCPGDCSGQSDANSVVEDVDTVVHDVLPILHYLEVGIAVGWPWVAAGKSTTLAAHYYSNGVELTSSFAYSQIPFSLDNDISDLTNNFGGFAGVGSSDGNSQNTRYGLPVQSDKYSNLCKVAIIYTTSGGGLISVPGFIDQILNYAGNWLCDAGADSADVEYGIEYVSDVILPCVLYGPFNPVHSLPPSDDSCCSLAPATSSTDVDDSTFNQSPMALYQPAKMGLDYYGVWSTAVGGFKDVVTGKVQIAGQQSKAAASEHVVIPIPDDTPLGIAKAEFYYDPRPGDSKADEKEVQISEGFPLKACMWNMRWRARLRRYHNFPGLLGSAGNLFDLNWSQAGKVGVASALNGDSPTEVLTNAEAALGGSQETQVDTYRNEPTTGIYH